jgi:hypothetical protein
MTLRYGSGADTAAESFEAHDLAALPTFNDIVERYPGVRDATCVFAAGSVVLGWGHGTSDLDLYVISERRLDLDESLEVFQRTISTSDPEMAIAVGEAGRYRLDIEFWLESQVDEVIARFTGDVVSQEAPDVGEPEQDMMYRLASGRPLQGDHWWRQRRAAILGSSYATWLSEHRKMWAESLLEDIVGLAATDDVETAVLAAHSGLILAVEALLASYGDLSVSRKWLYRRVVDTAPPGLPASEAWSALAMQGAFDDPRRWIKETGDLIQRLLYAVERHNG